MESSVVVVWLGSSRNFWQERPTDWLLQVARLSISGTRREKAACDPRVLDSSIVLTSPSPLLMSIQYCHYTVRDRASVSHPSEVAEALPTGGLGECHFRRKAPPSRRPTSLAYTSFWCIDGQPTRPRFPSDIQPRPLRLQRRLEPRCRVLLQTAGWERGFCTTRRGLPVAGCLWWDMTWVLVGEKTARMAGEVQCVLYCSPRGTRRRELSPAGSSRPAQSRWPCTICSCMARIRSAGSNTSATVEPSRRLSIGTRDNLFCQDATAFAKDRPSDGISFAQVYAATEACCADLLQRHADP